MIKQCHHHFLVNQEKAEKHVFRKSKKYRSLCSVALGTMVTAIFAWGGSVAQADEVSTTTPLDTTVQLTKNPATNLAEAQAAPVAEHTSSLASTGQSDGAITVTVPHDTVTQAVHQAEAEGVETIQDHTMTNTIEEARYQALKEQYEDETLDYSFSKREITNQLEIIISTRENDFPDLDEVMKEEYLDLVRQLESLDKEEATYYRQQLEWKEE